VGAASNYSRNSLMDEIETISALKAQIAELERNAIGMRGATAHWREVAEDYMERNSKLEGEVNRLQDEIATLKGEPTRADRMMAILGGRPDVAFDTLAGKQILIDSAGGIVVLPEEGS